METYDGKFLKCSYASTEQVGTFRLCNTTELLDAIKEQVAIMETEHAKTSKAARGRARSAANSIKKLAADFKKTSTAEDKA